MVERWGVDASPLIALGKIGRLDLLYTLAAEVYLSPNLVSDALVLAGESGGRG